MKQSNFFALTSLVAMGVMFVSCTNVDNPYNTTPPDGKYVLVKDSVVDSSGDSRVDVWEYDAQGRMAKETTSYRHSNGSSDKTVTTFTYSENLITRKAVKNDETPSFGYFYLNSKGLVERYIDETMKIDCSYEYDNDDRIMTSIEDGRKNNVVWDNGDVVKAVEDGDDGITFYFASSNHEVNFPMYMPYLSQWDSALSIMGLFGKAPRHLISRVQFESASDGKTQKYNEVIEYDLSNGLVTKIKFDIEDVVTRNGEIEDYSHIEYHYLTWKKQ